MDTVHKPHPSRPVWARGLKRSGCYVDVADEGVAPRVGAWIETFPKLRIMESFLVAPRVGAWIETSEERG